ncbi:hypothetical protein DL764_002289 [Monosporascus ibericus]|uniref:mitogen-activated protein kinase n=1 Tax=Monosporascus ibericus TaxID=155417 RepID=A0A4Q4TNH8_9PEZI|nr:hypothetical protein DL764_002289 [Monosporascus ibericus]
MEREEYEEVEDGYKTLENFREQVEREIKFLRVQDDPNIVRYYDARWGSGGNKVEIYMECLRDGNIAKYTRILVHHISSDQVVFKLCDFGLSIIRFHDGPKHLSYGGTSGFIAPEVTRDNPDGGTKADIFCLGSKPSITSTRGSCLGLDRNFPHDLGSATTGSDTSGLWAGGDRDDEKSIKHIN